ncbi:hypothetical protein M9H77_18854 [Catharanthus roseus]|uniref:Uncharacterized protein n=1 Tax=Catharanthus roseus TaxID=4058 RepID=A0ACC0B8L1_CATRO|nr:hypothetical protein M9H77_18854 [Catharanthus roseus]
MEETSQGGERILILVVILAYKAQTKKRKHRLNIGYGETVSGALQWSLLRHPFESQPHHMTFISQIAEGSLDRLDHLIGPLWLGYSRPSSIRTCFRWGLATSIRKRSGVTNLDKVIPLDIDSGIIAL